MRDRWIGVVVAALAAATLGVAGCRRNDSTRSVESGSRGGSTSSGTTSADSTGDGTTGTTSTSGVVSRGGTDTTTSGGGVTAVGPALVGDLGARAYVEGHPARMNGPVVIEFGKNVAVPERVGSQVTDDTVVEITPKVKGTLRWNAANKLVLALSEPLAFDTDYTIRLKSVATTAGVKKPTENAWQWKVHTAAFTSRHASLERLDARTGQATVLLAFNGDPDLSSLKKHLHVSVDGQAREHDLKPSGTDRVRLTVHGVPTDAKHVVVQLTDGIEATKARARTHEGADYSVPIQVAGAIRVYGLYPRETGSGFVVDVNCEDQAARKANDYYYWNNTCPLNPDEIADYVEVSPPVGVSVAQRANGFSIQGNFSQGSYLITLRPGMTSTKGGVLTRAYEQTINIPRRTPKVRFLSQGRYLPRKFLSNVPISHLNTDTVTLRVQKVHENNVVYWLSAPSEAADARISDVVASKTYTFESDPDVTHTRRLDLTDVIGDDLKGVFQLTLSAAGGQSTTSRLVLTDLTLLAKRFGDKGQDLRVWALQSDTLKPVGGASVRVMSQSNQELATCKTGRDGSCRIGGLPVEKKVGEQTLATPPMAIVVKADDDLSLLKFSDLEVALGDEDVHGRPFKDVLPYQAAVYADRGVYRPGETAHLVAILRDEKQTAPEAGLPAIAKFWDPKGKLVTQRRGVTNGSGMVAFDFEAHAFAPTGPYKMALEVGGNTIKTYGFNVEEFVPERMKVEGKAAQTAMRDSDEAAFEVEARYLFGAKASGEDVELRCSVTPTTFSSGQFKSYTFSPWQAEGPRAVNVGTVTGKLDENGKATVKCPAVDAVTQLAGPGRLTAMISVFEAGSGRTTTTTASTNVHPSDRYVGLASGKKKVEHGVEQTVNGVLVDWDGNVVKEDREVTVELMYLQSEWSWEWVESNRGSQQRWVQRFRPSVLDKTQVPISGGRFTYRFTPQMYGNAYLVRARLDSGVRADLELEGAGWSWVEYQGGQVDRTPQPQRPAAIQITAPGTVRSGEKTKATFTAPFAGRALFTVETDQLLEQRWLDVEPGEIEVPFEISQGVPNAYVSVLAIKDPHSESKQAFLPDRAFGVTNVKVKPEEHILDVAVTAPSEVQPHSSLQIKVATNAKRGEKVFATVAAVDEGILSLTRFKTPDPVDQLFDRRALGVATFETVGWTLMIPPDSAAGATGGDDVHDLGPEASRVMPVKPVALWSGVVELDDSGTGYVKLDVPLYRGELRVMAVASSASRSGSGSAQVTVRDPLVLTTTFPRFLISGDRFVVPVFVTNMTGKDDTIEVKLAASEGIKLASSDTARIPLKDGAKGTVTFVGRATESFGAAKFHVTARGGGTESRDEAELPFVPASPTVRESTTVALHNGHNDLKNLLEGWDPTTESTQVWVTSSKYGKELAHLKSLIRYPYG